MFRHQSHGGARAHDQPHVKTEAAAGGGRKASLYLGLVMRTQSPMSLRATGGPAAVAHHGSRNLVRNPLETSKNLFFAGPRDTPAKIRKVVRTLTYRVGEGNFDYIVPVDGL